MALISQGHSLETQPSPITNNPTEPVRNK